MRPRPSRVAIVRSRETDLLQQNTLCRVSYLLTLLVGVTFVAPAAFAEPADLADLAASPHDYLDNEVEITGYCVKGGLKGDVLGYECTTEGTVYVNTGDIEPAAAKEKVEVSCNGEKQDAACRATIRFVPHSFSTSNVIEPNKTITIFNTKKAELSF
jgi:hypothetical protein